MNLYDEARRQQKNNTHVSPWTFNPIWNTTASRASLPGHSRFTLRKLFARLNRDQLVSNPTNPPLCHWLESRQLIYLPGDKSLARTKSVGTRDTRVYKQSDQAGSLSFAIKNIGLRLSLSASLSLRSAWTSVWHNNWNAWNFNYRNLQAFIWRRKRNVS